MAKFGQVECACLVLTGLLTRRMLALVLPAVSNNIQREQLLSAQPAIHTVKN